MSQRSITCENSVTFHYQDELTVTVSRSVYPDDPDDPGCTLFTVDLDNGAGHAQFTSFKNLERYHKAIGYFLEQLDKKGGVL